jgi:hypothetical protein
MRIAIFLQLLWVIGSVFLNLAGIDQVESGEVILSPEPSLSVILILLAIGILQLMVHGLKLKVVFRFISLLIVAYAGYYIYKSFSTDPEGWLNTSWQWGGAAINLFGVLAGLTGVLGKSLTRGYRPDPISPVFNETNRSRE